jgi:hypothetical protein
MLLVDLLHEFELGVWKAVFAHLIRILIALHEDGDKVLDERYAHFTSMLGSIVSQGRASTYEQVSADPHLWTQYDPEVSHQCIGDEETGR